jgi:hypothetical protein
VLLVILFVAYFCGGYVSGRMARFNGARQGVAVWLWAVLVAVVVAILGVVGGSKYDVLSQLNSFPRIPVNEGDLTTGALLALLAIAVGSLAGAILGGMTGMHSTAGRPGGPGELMRLNAQKSVNTRSTNQHEGKNKE